MSLFVRRYELVYFAILAITGCSDSSQPKSAGNPPPQDRRVNGTGLVDHISYDTVDRLPHINVWPVKATPLGVLADLDIFGDLRPGMTFQEAASRHGKPFETRMLENLTELRCYRATNDIIAVGREPLRSSSSAGDSWTVWAFPGGAVLPLN